MSGLSRGCRTCCQKQQNKIQPANKKASANFSGAKIRGAHFPAGGIFQAASLFPGWSASISHLHSAAAASNPSIAKCFFAASVFQTRKHEVHIFQHPKPLLPARPANISHCQSSFHTSPTTFNKTTHSFPAPAGRLPPVLLLYRAQRLPPTTSTFLPAPAGQHLPPPFFPYRPHNLQ